MSIKNKKKELSITLEEIKNEEIELKNYRNLIQEKKKELDEIKTVWKTKIDNLKNLKIVVRTSKEYLKQNKKKRKNDSINGFTKPVKVEEKLEKFLNLKKGEYTTRTFIWKNIYSYIVKNNLALDSDKRNIISSVEQYVCK